MFSTCKSNIFIFPRKIVRKDNQNIKDKRRLDSFNFDIDILKKLKALMFSFSQLKIRK